MPKPPKRLPVFLLCLLAFSAGPAWSAAGPRDAVPETGSRFAQPGVVVVKFLSPVGPLGGASKTGLGTVDRLLADHGLQSIEPLAPGLKPPSKPGRTDLSRVYIVRYADGEAPNRVALQLSRLDDVEYAEPLYAYSLEEVPNDPSYAVLQTPHLGHQQFPGAWDLAKGDQGSVVVAVIDGGTDWQHNDLVANVWSNPGEIPGNGIDDDNNGYVDDVRGWNFGNNTNDPKGLPSTPQSGTHGTHTAGIACAVTNNGLQVAGASWNAKLMPINAAFATVDRVIAWGYSGIVYAAENGADVISLSWGGTGSPSIFEQEVINFAWEAGAAVCAASGNDSAINDDHYPSAYEHVLSVTNVGNDDKRVATANIGYTVDIAAHGQVVLSTTPNNSTGALSGTSMSTPFVAGACALVKTRWPGYQADQVMQRVRVTSDNIASIQLPGYGALMGYGRLNAFQALTKKTPAIRVTDIQIQDPDHDGVIEAGEIVDVTLTVTNFLSQALSVNFDLTETSVFATVLNPSQSVSTLDSLQSLQLPTFQVQIAGNTPSNTKVSLTLDILSTIPNYADLDRFDFVVQPLYLNHTGNQISTSVTSTGRVGYALELGGNGQDGIGFNFAGGPNVLFEAALLLGTDANHVVDAARGSSDLVNDFATASGGSPHYLPPILSDEQSTATFNDAAATQRIGLELRQDAYQFASPPDDDYIILRYRIRNTTSSALTGLRIGWFQDWDIGDAGEGDPAGGDRSSYDPSRGLGYMWDENGRADGVYVGTMVLTSPGTTIFRGIWNDDLNPSNPSFGVYSRSSGCSSCNGYTKDEKWQTLSEGITYPDAGPDDVSMSIGTGGFDIPAGDSTVVAFAFLAGSSLPDLQANADQVATMWETFSSITPVTLFGLEASLDGADVLVRWESREESNIAAFRVFRSRDGEPLQALQPDLSPNTARRYTFRDATPAPGHYVYRVAEVSPAGDVVLHGGVEIDVDAFTPGRSYLSSGIPNPFNPSTTLRYGVSTAGPVRLVIYDARGRSVRTLVQTAYAAPGTYSATWNGLDDGGHAAPSGSYHVRLQVAGQVFTRRLTLLK